MGGHDDAAETSSQRSAGSGNSGNMSETSSQRSATRFLQKRAAGQQGHNNESDLLEQKKNLQDGVFTCMHTLVLQSALSNWKFAVLRVILDFVMTFIVAFNPSFSAWQINTHNPFWQVLRWTVWRSPIMRLYGYRTYVIVMYFMVGAVVLSVVGLGWLTLAMRKQEQSKLLHKAAAALHIVYDLMYIYCNVAFFDYFVFMADCDFTGTKEHVYFTGVVCTSMPHLLHMLVALATAVLFLLVTALMTVASCDLNPASSGYLASPAAVTQLRILAARAFFIVMADCLDGSRKLQALGMAVSVLLILYVHFREMPFYRKATNVVWTGLWGGILYTSALLCVIAFGKNHSVAFYKQITQYVLYGMFPTVMGTMALTAAYVWWAMRPARKFRDLAPGVKITKVHKFMSVYDVERLARVMRKFDIDGVMDEDAAAFGETIIKAGMQTFPNSPHLLILYANFKLEVRKDGPAARTHLQLASKQSPNLVERYQIFCTLEASKKLKDSQEGAMDLQAYIEFKRNFRAVLRVHKEVLLLQTEVWQMCMRSSLRVAQFDAALDGLEAAAVRANQVYKRVLERYPTNGKLLRCYGKFLEDVVHDQVAAARAYAGANRNGGANALLSLDLGGVAHGDRPDFLTSMSMEDDAVVVIDAEGTIMMTNQVLQRLFGYVKTELEGANVSLLMPQPFSQRHPGYLARYVATGEAHILDSVREVVALHKERYVFPVAMCVTRLSGVGSDSIFLGLLRPLPADVHNLRAWVAPNGVFLCADQQFASAVGMSEGELVGHPLASMVTRSADVEALMDRCREAPESCLLSGILQADLELRHRYRDSVPVHVTVRMAGTDGQRILVLHCRRTDGSDGSLLAVDSHMRVRFASCEVAILLGYTMRKLATMRLDQILPQPHNALHAKWLRDPPHAVRPGGCRSGGVVHLLAETGVQVPVRLKISTVDVQTPGDASRPTQMYAVQVTKARPEEVFLEKRLVLTTDFTGKVLAVSPPDSAVFGFRGDNLVGSTLHEAIDIFADWRQRSGDANMQLIMLALLYKEQEMPGTSWRVRVHEPIPAEEGASLPGVGASHKPRQGQPNISACLQVEMFDESEDEGDAAGEDEISSRVRITLWRRDLLGGVLELDEELVIRKASPLTGLITGLPTTAMLRKPLNRFLTLPPASSWDQLVAASHGGGSSHKKSALKATSDRGSISPVMAFVGPHPDSGTMRLFVQGVQTLGPGGRPKVTLTVHPDTTFVGAHADLMRVLKLDDAERHSQCGTEGGSAGTLTVKSAGARSRRASAKHSRATSAAPRRIAEADDGPSTSRQEPPDSGPGAAGGEIEAGGTAIATQARGASGAEAEAGAHGQDALTTGSGAAGAEAPGGGLDQPNEEGENGPDDDGDRASDNGSDGLMKEATSLHRHATNKSEFVEQWVRSLSRQGQRGATRSQHTAEPPEEPGESGALAVALRFAPMSPPGAAARLGSAGSRLKSGPLSRVAEEAEPGAASGMERSKEQVRKARTQALNAESSGPNHCVSGLTIFEEGGVAGLHSKVTEALTDVRACSPEQRVGRKGRSGAVAAASRRTTEDGAAGDEDQERGRGKGRDDNDAASESGESSADESQAAASIFSAATDATSAAELVVDARRARLLKALHRLLLGPALMQHVRRLTLHSYALIAMMFLTHVVSYGIITKIIAEEHINVYNVHRQAMAMDRSQLITVRAMVGAFCARANVTEHVGICANSMSYTLGKLATNIALMEEYHQGVYLGFKASQVTRPAPQVYRVWTSPELAYHVYLDTQPPQVLVDHGGAWELGNRYIAAAREAMHLLPKLGDMYKLHRTFQFILTNGLGPLFEGYAASLDLLVSAAWDSIQTLRMDLIVLMAVEAILVQVCCTLYMLFLVQKTETARLAGVLAMIGLPAPVLRQLSTAETRIIEDSDCESDDNDSAAGDDDDRHGRRRSAAPLAAPGTQGTSRPDVPSLPEAAAATAPRAYVSEAVPSGLDGQVAHAGESNGLEERPAVAQAAAAGGIEAAVVRGDSPLEKEQQGRRVLHHNSTLRGSKRSASGSGKSYMRLSIGGKTIAPSHWSVSKFMAPFVLWNLAVILIYAMSLYKLNGMQAPLASLNMASHVTYRYTRVRAVALGFVTQDDAASRAVWRSMLTKELSLFESEYNAVMYGGEPSSLDRTTFRRSVPAGTFASNEFSQAFFRSKDCFRYNKSACFPPSSEYYEVTHNGIDVMVRRMVSEMRLLALDDDVDVVYYNPRYIFMAAVAANDLYEGLQQAAQLFVDYSISRYNEVTDLHTILLAVSVALVVGFFVFILWPHTRHVLRDATKLAALLSMVPPELDVRGHVRSVFRRRAAGRATVTGGRASIPGSKPPSPPNAGPPTVGLSGGL